MSSRKAILEAVRANRPAATQLPEAFPSAGMERDVVAAFVEITEAIGGKAFLLDSRDDAASRIGGLYPDARRIASAVAYVESLQIALETMKEIDELASVDLFVCEGTLGVAENGAIWLPESRLLQRAALFLAEHLVIVLDRQQIVGDLHEAYERIRIDEEGFGAFIAGPSKTADIEQSLVIGAHGPSSLSVLLY